MSTRVAGIVAGLLVAGTALAQNSNPPKPATPATVSPHQATAKKPPAHPMDVAATSATAVPANDQATTVTGRKAKLRDKGGHADAAPNVLTAIPQADRLAIQSDLAWLGAYDDVTAGDFDPHTVEAIKAFQKRNGGKDTGVLTEQERALLAAAVKTRETAVGWRLIDDPATGARLGLPEKLVPKSSAARTGSRWTSGLGQIQVETFRLHEAALPALFDDERKTPRLRQITYSALAPDSFVIAGEQKLKKFLVRAQASGGEVRGITILYDQATEGTMDRIALAMANAFQGFPDPNVLPSGSRRSVEYGTGIVVSSRGHLIVPAQLTDECQAITVPGFGHADRVAEDKTTDLALLRLYGARNLSAAPLAADSGKTDDLTLFGVADPLAQAGGGAVTSTAAHLSAQGVEPAPKLGFSGAAAVDTQGHVAGMVELTLPVIAGSDAAGLPAALVPAKAIRAFLLAHGVTPAAGHAALDQSVVRVICVRK